jgi:shikimate dehydrogenase
MIRLGLIGYPLGHSLSPRIHEAALRSCGLEGSYSVFPIPPNDQKGLKDLLELVRNREITGLNVTIPHKQNVIPFLDDLTPTAKSIGAVNTIYMQENRLIGENTDAPGFLADLKRFLTTETCFDSAQHRLRHGELKAFVLGAGGSARAVVYALLNDGWEVLISARRLEQAEQLVDALTNHQFSQNIRMGPITVLSLSDMEPTFTNLQSQISNLSLIVNTTPVGMTPNIDQSPWPENLPFPPRAAIYDLVYNPGETKLVIDARLQGLHATTGLGMLIEQAALAFQIWTDRKPSRESMFEAVNQTVN